jgi:hypothetical protein
MNPPREPTQRTYSEAELASLFTTYFGDKLTQRQLDSLIVTVAAVHANRQLEVPPSFGGWARAQPSYPRV